MGTSVLAALAAPLAAQEPQCAMPDPNATAACNTAVDAMRAFHPLAGMIVSGGNPVLGTSGSLGGIGHLTITARVNAIRASLPNPEVPSTRSEEHTSELQSRRDLVCRLLLEKKKKIK